MVLSSGGSVDRWLPKVGGEAKRRMVRQGGLAHKRANCMPAPLFGAGRMPSRLRPGRRESSAYSERFIAPKLCETLPRRAFLVRGLPVEERSEEHTSELQSREN